MHPRDAAAFNAHVAPHLAQGEAVEAGVRAVTGGFMRRQNNAILAGIALFAAAVAAQLAVLDWPFHGWLEALFLPVFVVPAVWIARRLHARARAAGDRGFPGDAVRRESALLLAVTDRRLLVFARKGATRFGALLGAYPLRAVRAVQRIPTRAFPARMPKIHLDLAKDGTLDLELLDFDRAEDFLEALEEGRETARRGGRA